MGAAAFVGRVGGLAIALGVGVMAGIPVAAADGGSGGPSTDASAASTDTPRATGRNTGRQTRPDRDARRSDQRPGDRRSPAGAPPSATTPPERPAEPAAAVVVPEAKPVAVAQDQDQDQGRAEAPAGAAAVAVTEPDQPAQADAAAHVPAPLAMVTPSQVPSAAPPAAEPAEVTALATASQGGLLDPRAGGVPGGTGESPLSWATLAFARRQIGNTASATAATAGITVNPDVVWSDGVLVGSLDATSGRDLPLTYAVVDRPSLGGKLTWEPRPTGGAPTGRFAYLPDMSTLTNPGQSESFAVLVAEETAFDTFIKGIPLIGALFDPLLKTLHQVPFLSSLLAPIIGSALVVDFTESAATLAAGRPVAFTHLMRSFDDTPISVNYFPATNVATGETSSAPTILNGPELGFPGNTDPFSEWDTSLVNIVPGINPLRTDASPFAGGYSGGGGYNVITWDPRGEYASGGRMQLDNPNFEGRDVSAIITWATSAANVARSQVATDPSGDPFIGMVGGSYGGGIQLAVAGTPDKRVDAIVPSIAWNTLNESLYLNNTFKTTIGSELLLALAVTGARINNQIYAGILSGSLLGFLSSDSQALLTNAGPGLLVKNIQAPTLFIQGIPDILFEL
ncbi:MAG: peptidase S15, partial [Mycobacterium sp.]|nr:peptidase S15 [Mycobacterium sp.]